MDMIDKVTGAAGDMIAKARERERVRLEDALRQLDRIEAHARAFVEVGKSRLGLNWGIEMESSRLEWPRFFEITASCSPDSSIKVA